jgi:hypothetical protein
MKKKIFLKIVLILSLIIITWFVYSKYFKEDKNKLSKPVNPTSKIEEDAVYNSNIIKDINYTSRDLKGNEYILIAKEGEIDLDNSDIIFLTDVTAYIKLVKNSELIVITSNYGKYNSNNFDTIFSKNVVINYLDNKITSDYLDLSMQRNSMIISKDVTLTNSENILKADVVEMNIGTKDIKVFMHKKNDKIEIKNK